MTPFPSTKPPLFTLNTVKLFYYSKNFVSSLGKVVSEAQTVAINTLESKGHIQVNKADGTKLIYGYR